MSAWYVAAFVLSLALAPCGYLALCRADPFDRLVGIETAGMLQATIIMLLAQASGSSSFYDVALAMAILTAGAGLVFVRFLERWG